MPWPESEIVEELFDLFRENEYPDLPIDVPEKEFRKRCDQNWALNDLLLYLNENWFEDTPLELISNYIDDCRYRAEKYIDRPMGQVYQTARETAEAILHCFEIPILIEEESQ